MSVPLTPSNQIVQQGNGQVYVKWDLTVGVDSWDVQRSTDGISYSSIASPTVPEYLDTSVTSGVGYYYKVRALTGTDYSGFTSPYFITPCQSGQMSLGELRLLSQQRADRVGSDFVTQPEWNTYINQSYFELYDILVTAFEDYNVAEPLIFATDGTSTSYALPNGVNYSGARPLYKLLGVDMGLASTTNAWVTLHKYNFISRNRYVYPNLTSTYLGVFNLRYRVLGENIQFIPQPSGGQYLRLWYIPRLETLLKDTDLCEGISGWTEYIVVDAAIKALIKEESDTQMLMLQKQALLDRIQSAAQNRDAGQPDTVSDVRSRSEAWGGWGTPNGDGPYGGY